MTLHLETKELLDAIETHVLGNNNRKLLRMKVLHLYATATGRGYEQDQRDTLPAPAPRGPDLAPVLQASLERLKGRTGT